MRPKKIKFATFLPKAEARCLLRFARIHHMTISSVLRALVCQAVNIGPETPLGELESVLTSGFTRGPLFPEEVDDEEIDPSKA